MAQIKNGHFGSYQGKIGAVTGRKRLGKFYISQSITHNGSRTNKQLRIRAIMSAAAKFCGMLAVVANDTYAKRAGEGKTAFNLFTGAVIDDAIAVEQLPDGNWEAKVLPEKVELSKGPVPGINNLNVTVRDGKMNFTWNANLEAEGALASDYVCVVAVNREAKGVQYLKNDKNVVRSTAQSSLVFPKAWVDSEVDVYFYLKSAESGKFSDSIYMGSITLSE